jgi:hypothetical protein
MKKLFFLTVLALCSTTFLLAQAYEGTTKYDKKTQRAILIDYDYPQEAVKNAFINKMAKLGYKPKEEKGLFNRDKGFIVFNSAYVTDISNEALDYIIDVERKSRKESDNSTLYLIMAKGDENAMEKMDVLTISSAKMFLNNLLPEVEAANLEIQIKDQEEKIAKAEKKLRDLRDDQASLEKKLEDNKKDQENTQKDIESQKQALGVLIGKRASAEQ